MDKMKKDKISKSTIIMHWANFFMVHTLILLVIDEFYPLSLKGVGIYCLIAIIIELYPKKILEDVKEYFKLKKNVESVLQSLINETQYKPIVLEEYFKLPSLSIVQVVNLLLDQEPVNIEYDKPKEFNTLLLKYLMPNTKSREIIDAIYSSLYSSYSFQVVVKEDSIIHINVLTKDKFDTIKIIDLVLSNKDLKHLTKKHIYEELKLAQNSLISS